MEKERYLTPETIQVKAKDFLDLLSQFRSHHSKQIFRPQKAALFILDMQDYFLQPDSHAYIPSAPAIIEGIAELQEAFAAAQRPIVLTRHLDTPGEAGMMLKWWRSPILIQDGYSRLHNAFDTSKGVIIQKSHYDAFMGTALNSLLRNNGVEQVVITGVMTHLCCDTTARSAFMHDFEVFFAVDGTATYTEAMHRGSMLALAHGFALPVTVGDILAGMDSLDS